MKPITYYGRGSLGRISDILQIESPQKTLIVTNDELFELSGAKDIVLPAMTGMKFHLFTGFSPNPKFEEIESGLALCSSGTFDLIIAIGGGSAIDTAKAIKLFNYRETYKAIPLVAVPTTAGTGSEATYFIAYYRDGQKQSEGVKEVTIPDYAIVDPDLTKSLPTREAASSGIDALAQAIESYWSIYSTDESKEFSRKAIALLFDNLETSTYSPASPAREHVMYAANLAGKAISITKTTACHAISYPMTAHFGIPHGHAAGLTLGQVLIYNSLVSAEDCLDTRGPDYVKRAIVEIDSMFGSSDSSDTAEKIHDIMRKIGLKARLSELGVTRDGINLILDKGFAPERIANNPRRVTRENLEIILNDIF